MRLDGKYFNEGYDVQSLDQLVDSSMAFQIVLVAQLQRQQLDLPPEEFQSTYNKQRNAV